MMNNELKGLGIRRTNKTKNMKHKLEKMKLRAVLKTSKKIIIKPSVTILTLKEKFIEITYRKTWQSAKRCKSKIIEKVITESHYTQKEMRIELRKSKSK